MTTKEAFLTLLDTPGIELKLKVGQSTIRSWKTRLKANKMSLDKMEEMLLKSGAKKTPEVWKF